ncbi:uncharacterized protein LOC104896952 isoform X2 [Beta vulgaris subsp. vulgaris]|uniref:uncharacterized protein LOC104896952 isoform X2 n=1 Tax=Beta vulgaris subsp. vulgaris TaxID=3555 RepID=UPI0020366B85|nr:uncharacterized protein LOC104896952 isoform X2 [Beta vulgaris subsp. vulgaris]
MASIMRAAATATATATATPSSPFLKSTSINHYHNYLIFTNYAPILSPHQFKSLSLSSSSSFRLNCRGTDMRDDHSLTTMAAAYSVLGLEPDCSAAQLKAAFRAKVKEFHPDVRNNQHNTDLMIRRVIQAYEILSNISRSEIIESECLDPFDNPECEAFDIFVNEVLCAGKGHDEDYQVQLAVGQCPRSCIHYVTSSQRIILEELLDSIMDTPYDTSAEADLLYSLIIKAKYENNRYQKPKEQPKASTKHVDWL